jgi:hypothetical protein
VGACMAGAPMAASSSAVRHFESLANFVSIPSF